MTAVELRELRLRDYTPRSQARAEVTEVPAAAIPCIDVHNHLGRWLSLDGDWPIADVSALVAAMDECRVEAIVNLDGRWGGELGDNLDRYDTAYPGRFYTFCQLDWRALAEPDGVPRLVRELREAASRGARGLKVWKDLGLHTVTETGSWCCPAIPGWRRSGRPVPSSGCPC